MSNLLLIFRVVYGHLIYVNDSLIRIDVTLYTICELAVFHYKRAKLYLDICALIPNETCVCNIDQFNIIEGHRKTISTI